MLTAELGVSRQLDHALPNFRLALREWCEVNPANRLFRHRAKENRITSAWQPLLGC